MAPLRLSFLIRYTYDQLSSKNNLFKGKKKSDPTRPQCNDKPQNWSMSSVWLLLVMENITGGTINELVRFIKNYMKSEPIISTQKFVAEAGKIYAGSKQVMKYWTLPGQNLLGSDFHLPTYLDGIMITQKQYLVRVCDLILFFCHRRTLKLLW